MKKLSLILLLLLLMVGCGEQTSEPEVTTVDFPYEKLNGCYCEKNEYEYFTFNTNVNNFEVTYGNFDGMSTGTGVVVENEYIGENVFNVSVKYEQETKKYYFDISDIEKNIIKIDNVDYTYYGKDVQVIYEKRKAKIVEDFYETMKGYWNSDEDNGFLYFGKDEKGLYWFNYGLWDAGGSPAGTIDSVQNVDGDYAVNVVYEDQYEETYLIKFTDAKNILCDGQAFHFVGQAEEARIDYENRFYN